MISTKIEGKKAKKTVRVGSRESLLAVAQARIVIDAISGFLPETQFELVTMKTQGDRFSASHPNSPIPPRRHEIVKGLFVKELESALAGGTIDFAVHSLKDMSVFANEELPIVAVSPREVPYDVVVFRKGFREGGIMEASELSGLVCGCSSARRRVQLQRLVDCTVKPIRGNIVTRLEKLDKGGEYDFLVLAAAGLIRLGMTNRIGYCFPGSEILPAPGQGVLACQGRRGGDYSYLGCFHDDEAHALVTAERAFAAATGGGCSSPVAAHAQIDSGRGELRLDAFFADEETGIYERGTIAGPACEGVKLAETLAARMLER